MTEKSPVVYEPSAETMAIEHIAAAMAKLRRL
jgi:hypothetical protein